MIHGFLRGTRVVPNPLLVYIVRRATETYALHVSAEE